jgi:hypothetical protein
MKVFVYFLLLVDGGGGGGIHKARLKHVVAIKL